MEPPVVVAGMHRSGTSLTSRIMSDLGVFMGRGQAHHAEAIAFQELNRWILRQAGTSWDRPEGFDDLVEDEAVSDLVTTFVDTYLRGPRAIRYTGLIRYLRDWRDRRLSSPWGWKDPRNTVTFPVWQQLYPDARFVHVVRHGVDVADSLRRRREDRIEKRWPLFRRFRSLGWWVLPPSRTTASPRVRTLDGGLDLWRTYVEAGRHHLDRLGDRGLEVRFETLLEEPRTVVEDLAELVGTTVSEEVVEAVAAEVDPDRAYAFTPSPELRKFAESSREQLEAVGYPALPGEGD